MIMDTSAIPSPSTPSLTYNAIVDVVQAAVEPLGFVHALWLGGANSFHRVDAWSDIDMQICCEDDRVADVVAAIEQALPPVDLRFELPQPTWHGHWQAFYRFRDASPFLLLDLAIMKLGSPQKFLEPEIHGQADIRFDKIGVTQVPPLDRAAWTQRLQHRRQVLSTQFNMFQILTLKEINRGNWIEAVAFYHTWTLRPLIEALRIQHAPLHYDFATRYVYYDLPHEIVRRLEPFFFLANGDDLIAKHAAAGAWFQSLMMDLAA